MGWKRINMLRMTYVILICLPLIAYYIAKAYYIKYHEADYSEETRYSVARRCIRICMRVGRIKTKCSGQENLPEDGGYVMFPNHQGKFDVLGIIASHDAPCTMVMDYKVSKRPIVNPFVELIKGQRLDKSDRRKQVKTILDIVREVKEGRRYIIFPEGGYDHNHNELQDFRPGAFQCATKSKAPIVPVAIIDSYKVFNVNSLRKVTTQVHFLPAIPYEEYVGMTTAEIAGIVRERIRTVIAEKQTKGAS